MRAKGFGTMESRAQGLATFCQLVCLVLWVAVPLQGLVLPASAQSLPSLSSDKGRNGAVSAGGELTASDELDRERFRRRAAEAAQKQLEILADKLRVQLAEEIKARQAAEAVASELLSRAKLEEQIDSERQRLRSPDPEAVPNRAAVAGDTSQLKALVDDLQRRLKAAEWARKLAEAQLKVMTGNRER